MKNKLKYGGIYKYEKKLLAILMTSIITVSNVNAIFANQLSENLIEQTYSSSITSSRKSNDEIFQQELGGVYVSELLGNKLPSI